jgi:hypothetical protein
LPKAESKIPHLDKKGRFAKAAQFNVPEMLLIVRHWSVGKEFYAS